MLIIVFSNVVTNSFQWIGFVR